MDRIVFPGRIAAAMCASATLAAGAARAAVTMPLPHRADLDAVADRVHAFTVQVRASAFVAEQTQGPLKVHEAVATSSGVLIGDGLVLTALSSVALRDENGGLQPANEIAVLVGDVGPIPARLLAGNTGLDVAILLLPDQARSLSGASIATEDPNAGDSMVALGVDGDSIKAVAVLLERVAPGDDASARLHTEHALPPPFWGGPLFDDRGQLVGMTTRPTSAEGTAVPASVLRALLQRSLRMGGI
ncbi:MAG TPA: serine protease [Myxococcales bacterium]|nr:serine protease [Myxococcales bacterium]